MLTLSRLLFAFLSLLILSTTFSARGAERKVLVSDFGKTKDGAAVSRFVLTNNKGVEAVIISYGATLVSLKVPGRDGKLSDIVLGYDTLDAYEAGTSFFGATIGRYGNRIAAGQFSLDGTAFHLPKNDGPNTLHGGVRGFNKRIWTGADHSRADAQVLEMTYTSADGEEGFPGTLTAVVTFTLPAETNELRIDYSAKTDKDTVVNLTNHSYFNLSGDPSKEILDHQLLLRAAKFTPVDSTLIPTGELRAVSGTPFDFNKATAIGARINQDDEQLKFGKGYDHNWVLTRTDQKGLQLAAEVFEPTSGRVLEVLTTEPGLQFYSGNFLDGSAKGKGGQPYNHRTGLCLETQHFPDSPNHANFPSTELKPGQTYRTTTVLRFSSRK
ncbi:MAG: aldose epimerase family protein [Candidatus Acidiferrum sp.]|jgi:aldose 1-epimerase